MTWKIGVEELVRYGSPGYRLYAAKEHGEAFEFMAKPTIHTLDSRFVIPPEYALLDDTGGFGENVRDFLQAMSDAAWKIGIKPKQIEDNSNELKATKYRLEDMRKIAMSATIGDQNAPSFVIPDDFDASALNPGSGR